MRMIFYGDEVIEISDDEIEDGNGRKEESLGVEEKFVETNGEGRKVNMNAIVYDEGTEGENFEVERNHDTEFHNEKNDDYYVEDKDDISMALQRTFDD
ncbi:hypothetical protein HAX54_015393 [Datura stramonium]|uniref:Uncharacterized protein n=1 Tax=Datura stramonium TaxID=4076 RepID=A0ABS8TSU7_DATST|nr:hypothetical protein [Datura stramonium]